MTGRHEELECINGFDNHTSKISAWIFVEARRVIACAG
jgi:hypothetical protein